MPQTLRNTLSRAASAIAARLAPRRWKQFQEFMYWRRQRKIEGVLGNDHYMRFYTTHFGLGAEDYRGKTVVDLGCGPRGSLEWADMAARRIGVDPLADRYLSLGADRHAMEYLCAPSEAIPLDAGSCDIVTSFNSLDHVDDVERTVREIKRITRPGGTFLLLVEVNHPPKPSEPHDLSPEGLLGLLRPEFSCQDLAVYRIHGNGIYDSLAAADRIADPERTREPGYLSARFRHVAGSRPGSSTQARPAT